MNRYIKNILVTCALPYANGSIHIGHMLEHIQADIWSRYQRMRGNNVFFICADDAHGTPIMLNAQKLGISAKKMVDEINYEHKKDLSGFFISYDNYYSTHSDENKELVILIYNRLNEKGFIKKRIISQLYDPIKGIFLPDRFVKGKCPKCNSPDQYGDNCEICGATYSSTELVNPKSLLSSAIPVRRESEHFFFDLPYFTEILKKWYKSGSIQEQVYNKMQHWFSLGLKEWDISRDAPYFGFKIPNYSNKYFYVWFDAPIGYISAFKNFCDKKTDICFNDFWKIDSNADIYHFIGKDIVYFHSLFWPAILEGSDLRKPTMLCVHGYVTVNGTKMSKSRGTFIKASTYLKYLDADCLRYYYASKLSSRIDDINLNINDFILKVNSDIVNKVVNLAARNASFIINRFEGKLSDTLYDINLYLKFVNASVKIGESFNRREFNHAIRNIMELADIANLYIDKQSPWLIDKNNYKKIQSICSMGLNLFRIIMIYLKPVLPSLTNRTEKFLNTNLTWESINTPLINHKINNFKSLFNRIDIKIVESMLKTAIKEN